MQFIVGADRADVDQADGGVIARVTAGIEVGRDLKGMRQRRVKGSLTGLGKRGYFIGVTRRKV